MLLLISCLRDYPDYLNLSPQVFEFGNVCLHIHSCVQHPADKKQICTVVHSCKIQLKWRT